MEFLNLDIKENIDLINDPEILLKKLVSIDTRFNKQDNISDVQIQLSQLLEGLGFDCHFIHNLHKGHAPLLQASLKGTSSKTITFIGHSDVVTTPDKNPYQVDSRNNRIIGSGVADDKGGLVVCLRALALYLQLGKPHFNINVIISPSEEQGSTGFHHFFNEVGMKSDYVLGLEPALQNGSLISSRSGNRWIEIEVEGRSCHAGRFGEEHINAAHELAMIISELSQFNDEEKKVRINVGSMKTEMDIYNIICGKASAKFDLRFADFLSRDLLENTVKSVIAKRRITCPYSSEQAEISVRVDDDCPPLPQAKQLSDQLLKLEEIIEFKEGQLPGFSHAGGAADINYFCHPFNIGIDGLGPVGGGMHTNNEYILRDTLYSRSESIADWLVSLKTMN
jgi:glutamate carboxypeptidase